VEAVRPWQLKQSLRIQRLWGITGGAPGQARAPLVGAGKPANVFSCAAEALSAVASCSTWHWVQLA
jgi:hypothetical protein